MLAYKDVQGIENVEPLWFNQVEDYAAGLSEEEVLIALGTPLSKLNDIEKTTFKEAFAIGRAKAKKRAVDHLFSAMRDKGGQQASLAYLTRFSKEWSEEDTGVPPTGNFTFTVTKTP